jgi:hypothetical protein
MHNCARGPSIELVPIEMMSTDQWFCFATVEFQLPALLMSAFFVLDRSEALISAQEVPAREGGGCPDPRSGHLSLEGKAIGNLGPRSGHL